MNLQQIIGQIKYSWEDICIFKNILNWTKKVYNQTSNTYDWKVPSFMEISKYVNEYQETLKLLSVHYPNNSESDESKISIDPIIVSKNNDSSQLS